MAVVFKALRLGSKKAWVEQCRLGEIDWFIAERELLPSFQEVDERLPRSASEEPVLPVQIFGVKFDLYIVT
jgi:hypothetical protein